MKQFHGILWGLLILFFSGCGSTANLNPLSTLTAKPWVLSSFLGAEPDLSKFSTGVPTLSFLDGGRLAGFAGCNNFSGEFELGEPGAIKLDPGAMTRKACPGNGENEFLAEFEKAKNFKLEKEKLILMDGTTELMSFSPKID